MSKRTENLLKEVDGTLAQVRGLLSKGCPQCKSNHTVRHGFNVTKKRGKLLRRKCQECGTTFYENKGGDK